MPRLIVPAFRHMSGATELEHALDARRLDEAFSELAGVLNGGIDESNLNSTVKFSTVTPGGVNVGTAIGAKYSTLAYTGTCSEVGTDFSYYAGNAPSGSLLERVTLLMARGPSFRVTVTVGAATIFDTTGDATTGSPFIARDDAWYPYGYTYEPGSPTSCSGAVVVRLRFGSSVPLFASYGISFKEPVV